jgi:hypothetical protein
MRRMACRRPANDGTRTRNLPADALGLPDQQRALDRLIADRHFPTRSGSSCRQIADADAATVKPSTRRVSETIDFIATD